MLIRSTGVDHGNVPVVEGRSGVLRVREAGPVGRPIRTKTAERSGPKRLLTAPVGAHDIQAVADALTVADERDTGAAGDQAGWASKAALFVTFACAVPSAFMT